MRTIFFFTLVGNRKLFARSDYKLAQEVLNICDERWKPCQPAFHVLCREF